MNTFQPLSRRAFLQMTGGSAATLALAAYVAAPAAAPAAGDAAGAQTASKLQMYTRLTNNEQLKTLSQRYKDEHAGGELEAYEYTKFSTFTGCCEDSPKPTAARP